jgi:hypothetical protein
VGCTIVATVGTADVLTAGGVTVERVVGKVSQRSTQQGAQQSDQQGDLGDAVALISDGSIVFVINTPQAAAPIATVKQFARPPT